MNDTQSLATRIHLIYDDRFNDVKQEVFCHWIIETVIEAGNRAVLPTIKDRVGMRLGFAIENSARTEDLFNRSFEYSQAQGWIVPDPAYTAESGLPRYIASTAGKEQVARVDRERRELVEGCYKEFTHLLARRLFPANEEEKGSANDTWQDDRVGLLSQDKVIDRIESIYGGGTKLRTDFDNFLEMVSPRIAGKYLGAFDQSIRSNTNKNEPSTYQWKTIFKPELIHDKSEQGRFNIAISSIYDYLQGLLLHNEPHLRHWFYLRAYEQLFSKIWPDEDIQERLSRHLNCIHVYLDTNVIIAWLAQEDPLHEQANEIIGFLKRNSVKFFWLDYTHKELLRHMALAKDIVELIKQRPKKEINTILELTKPPSFVKTYFMKNWRSWEQFEDHVFIRYRSLQHDGAVEKVQSWVQSNNLFKEKLSTDNLVQRITDAMQESGRGRPRTLVRHDAYVLATIQVLRELSNPTLVSRECWEALADDRMILGELFWLVSFDRHLNSINISGVRNRDGKDDTFPITLLYETILLFLDPYVVSQALIRSRSTRLTTRLLMPLKDLRDLEAAIKKAEKEVQAVQSNSVAQFLKEVNEGQIDYYKRLGLPEVA